MTAGTPSHPVATVNVELTVSGGPGPKMVREFFARFCKRPGGEAGAVGDSR